MADARPGASRRISPDSGLFVALLAALMTMTAMSIDISLPAVPATACLARRQPRRGPAHRARLLPGLRDRPDPVGPDLRPLRAPARAASRDRALRRRHAGLRPEPHHGAAARPARRAGHRRRRRLDPEPHHHPRPLPGCRDGARDVPDARGLHHRPHRRAHRGRPHPHGGPLARHLRLSRHLWRGAPGAHLGLSRGEPGRAGTRARSRSHGWPAATARCSATRTRAPTPSP